MSDELLAGLTEREANDALGAWLNRRAWGTENPRFAGFSVKMAKGEAWDSFHGLEVDVCGHDSEWGLFTRSHESIHLILDAMNEDELRTYAIRLRGLIKQGLTLTTMELMSESYRATPTQKVTAALMALGLGRETL